jgi:hypothetical protein
MGKQKKFDKDKVAQRKEENEVEEISDKVKNKKIKKCRYFNRGYCKYKSKCKDFRSRRWGSSLPGRTCLQSNFFEISPFSGQNRVILGGSGGTQILFYWNPNIYCT